MQASGDWDSCSSNVSRQALLDSFPFYVLVIDSEHRIELANKAVTQALGVTPDAIIGHFCPKAVHGMDTAFPGCPLEEAVEHGNIAVERELFDSEHGRWLSSCVYPIGSHASTGQHLFLHIIQDIHDRKTAAERIRNTLSETVHALGAVVESKDRYTAGHQDRVAQLAKAIAERMGLAEGDQEGLHVAAMVHDIGKLSIPAEILSKPGSLTSTEIQLVRVHPKAGFDILKPVSFPWPVADIVLQHHERMDGSGYPQGLRGSSILLEARILAVSDVVEAMSSHRPYRPALRVEAALEELKQHKGILYDPRIVDACIAVFQEDGFEFAE